MTRRTRPAAALAALTLMLVTAPCLARVPGLDMDAAYAATRHIEAGGQRFTQQYFQQSALVSRMESHVQGENSVIILRGDRNLMWTVMPSQQLYMEIGLDSADHVAGPVDLPDGDAWIAVETLGRESVNGVPATAYRVRGGDGGDTSEGTLWVSDGGIAVRMELDGRDGPVRMELRDLRPGPQPAALFEPPAGYQRLALGAGAGAGGMLPGLPSLGAGQGADAPRPGDPDAPAEAGPGFLGTLADEAADEAKRSTTREVRRQVRENVGKGVRGLLGRP